MRLAIVLTFWNKTEFARSRELRRGSLQYTKLQHLFSAMASRRMSADGKEWSLGGGR